MKPNIVQNIKRHIENNNLEIHYSVILEYVSPKAPEVLDREAIKDMIADAVSYPYNNVFDKEHYDWSGLEEYITFKEFNGDLYRAVRKGLAETMKLHGVPSGTFECEYIAGCYKPCLCIAGYIENCNKTIDGVKFRKALQMEILKPYHS